MINKTTTPNGVSVVGYQPSLRDVIVTSATSAFAVGQPSFLARWSGTQWNVDAPPSNSPANRMMQGVWSDGPSNAWAVGEVSTILRWGGTSWSLVSDSLRPAGTRDNYNAVWGTGSDVWAVGDNTIIHCKAPTQTACANEAAGGGALLGIWGTSASNVFAVGDNGRILRYNGTSWTSMSSPTSRALARLSGTGPSDIWAAGDSVFIHFDGTQWTTVPVSGDLSSVLSHVPTPAERGPNGQFRGLTSLGLWARAPKEVYVGGQYGNIVRFDGRGWNEMENALYRHRITSLSGAPGANGCALAVTEAQFDPPGPILWRGAGPTGCFSSPMAAPVSWP